MESFTEYAPVLTLVLAVYLRYYPGILQASVFWVLYSYTLGKPTDFIPILLIIGWKWRLQLVAGWSWSLLGKAVGSIIASVFVGRAAASLLGARRAAPDQLSKTEVLPRKAHLIPCRTTHTRLFPQKHSFSYSYLTVGVPVGLRGSAGHLLTIDSESESPSWLSWIFTPGGWFDVNSADYLQRGTCRGGLRGKLNNYLASQSEEPVKYPYAYLVTAARFLGYHFNPVSFWYLYSSDKVLTAIILEVNNTFGERRPYFVVRDFEREKELPASNEAAVPRARVRSSWNKDFHVSPFSSRKGTYSLLASDPLDPDMNGFRGIDVTINLASSKGHPKMVARLFSVGKAIEPTTVGLLQKTVFLLSWFWVGFVTFPRIVKEAAALFFRRSLHVWYRPEPLKDSLGRLADDTEQILEKVFRRYLRQLVETSPENLVVKYVPSGIVTLTEEFMMSDATKLCSADAKHVEFRVLTPVFYSRFVRYAHDFEAIFAEMAESSTIWVDNPQLLTKIFLKKPSGPLQSNAILDYIPFKAIQRLRRRPEPIVRPLTSAAEATPSTTTSTDVREFRISGMDAFVLGQQDFQLRKIYKWAVMRMFVAERILGDYVDLLSPVESMGRVGLLMSAIEASRLSLVASR